MEQIYENMYQTNMDYLSKSLFVADPLLKEPYKDSRRCYALVTEGEWTFHPGWSNVSQSLNTLDKTAWIIPQLHHTFLTLTPDGYSTKDFTNLQKDLNTYLPKGYTVTFDRIIPVKTGMVICGTPSIDINSVRDELRKYVEKERYYCDIAHATLFRATEQNMDLVEQQAFINHWVSLGPSPFATFVVKKINIVRASWCMYEGTYDFLALKKIQ